MSYNPAAGAVPDLQWHTAMLSQRDLSFRVPINYVTRPGVSLTGACFSQSRYESTAARRCFSNLLAIGFSRFVVDLYWDVGRQIWSLCPAQIPGDQNSPASTSTPVSSPSATSVFPVSLVASNERRQIVNQETSTTTIEDPEYASSSAIVSPSSTVTSDILSSIVVPQVSSVASNVSAPTVAVPGQARPTFIVTPSDEFLYTIGPYMCTPTANIQLVIDVLLDYIETTDDTIEGYLEYLILNLHVGASSDAPTEPAQSPAASELPTSEILLGDIFRGNMSSYLYTPAKLLEDRSNLNASWNQVPAETTPEASYFYQVISTNNDTLSSPDGWPTEAYVLFGARNRLMIGLGLVDPQLASYNFAGDSKEIFAQGQLQSNRDVKVNESGIVIDGCFYDPDETETSIANASWAISDTIIGLDVANPSNGYVETAVHSVRSLVACGVSPFLNQSVANVTADSHFQPYQNIAYNSIWSWASGEPRDSSVVSTDSSRNNPAGRNDPLNYRCAVLDTSIQGRWRVADCLQDYYAACRDEFDPYKWTMSADRTTYISANNASICPGNTTFSAPHTGLENTYLYSKIRAERPDLMYSTSSSASNQTFVWVNFNDRDVEGCWVEGVDLTCPYTANDSYRRTVVIPIVAAVIICVVTGLFLFVKFASHRKDKRRRRKRKSKGWDYEGVPG